MPTDTEYPCNNLFTVDIIWDICYNKLDTIYYKFGSEVTANQSPKKIIPTKKSRAD